MINNKVANQYTHPWTVSEIDFVQGNIGKMTYKQMCEIIDRTPASIQSKVRYLPLKQKVKKYPVNINFFKQWSAQMAYILGFIAADGNIVHSGRAHQLQIASDDEDIIIQLKKAMAAEVPIIKIPRFNGKISYQLKICDPIIYADLLALGITPRKSTTLRPQKVPEKFLNHYLRGFFDGDGTVYINRKNHIVFCWYTASPHMARFLFHCTREICPSYKGKIITLRKNKGYYYSITLSRNNIKLMFKFLYRNASIFMNRKYEKFLEGLNET